MDTYGISQHRELAKRLIFKGGTVLKKVYFSDYRFSEDLDFTLVDNEITNKQIFESFKEVFEFIKQESNIPVEVTGNNNEHEDGGINFYIGYVGPLGGQGSNKKVKVDISRSEELVFEPIMNDVIAGYSDLGDYQLLCYPLEEVFVEKMRSVMQRMQARDFYDFWYLLEVQRMDIGFYVNEFRRKCECKGLDASEFARKLTERLPQYKGRWKSSLREQIKDLPSFDKVQREIQRRLKGK